MEMYKEYYTDVDNINESIRDNGVCVIPNVLDETEITNAIDNKWECLRHFSMGRLKREDPSTWRDIFNYNPLHSMLLQHYQFGHHQYVWDIRQNPKVYNIFKTIWDDDDLLVSFDGVSIHMPHETTNRGYFRKNIWLHSDQSYQRNDFECIQGMVTLYDVEEGDATLKVLEGSNKYHGEYAQYRKKNGEECPREDWFRLEDDGLRFYKEKGCNEHNILAKAGSLILWDSRTIHQGVEPLRNRERANHRTVVYVCMTPRKRAKDKDIRKKQKAFNEMRMTSHWPHKIKLFPKLPRSYGKEMPEVNVSPPPVLTDLGRRLAGF